MSLDVALVGGADTDVMYRLLVQGVTDYAIYMIDPSGRIANWNEGAERAKGYTASEIVGRHFSCFYSEEDRAARMPERNLATARSASARCEDEGWRVRKDGSRFWAHIVIDAIRDEDGTLIGFAKVTRDVTVQHLAALNLQRAKDAAEAAASAKAEFLANMSHELRTPLAGMLGVYDLLEGGSITKERQAQMLRMGRQSARLLMAIVNDILDYSKIEAGQLAIEHVPFSLRDLIDTSEQFSRDRIADSKAMIVFDTMPGMPDRLLGDPMRIQQVLSNLITNALKFTSQGTVSVRATWAADRLRIQVSDTGIGIAADVIPRLFQRFSQADGSTARRFGGAGLGLAICKRLVDLMKGEIGVTSEPNRGSTFWFELALPIARRTGPEIAPGLAASVSTRTLRILLAEDNAINQEIVRAMLGKQHHQMTLVSDGAAAVQAFRDCRFDIVLMDVQMPEMDGLVATAQIRAWEALEGRSRTPIVALTAGILSGDVELCSQAGMDAHVAKPIDWQHLFATMKRLCPADIHDSREGMCETSSALARLDDAVLAELAETVGPQRIGNYLAVFAREMKVHLIAIRNPSTTTRSVSDHVHAMTSMSGQLGFLELSNACASVTRAIWNGHTPQTDDLFEASHRALEAASHSRFTLPSAAA